MYPVSYEADYEEPRNRLTSFFRYIVDIPWLIVAGLYGIVASIATFIAWCVLILTGRYPDGLYNFNAGYLRMQSRVNAFSYLLTDAWPPFGGQDEGSYPVRIGIVEPLDSYSRVKVLFRLIVGIPVMVLAWVQSLIMLVVAFIGWFAILFTGRLGETLFNPLRAALAYQARALAYFLLMTEDWPPFSLEEGEVASAGQIASESATRRRQATPE